jgi:hypothetical protein
MTPYDGQLMAEIDPLALDAAWLEQPRMYVRVSGAMAEARHEMDVAKNQLLIVEAECDKQIRARPNKYGIDKITEKSVATAVQMHPRMRAAQTTLLEAKYEVDMLSGLQQSLEHRKEALKALTTLFLNEYYGSGPAAVDQDGVRKIGERSREKTRKKGQTKDLPRGRSTGENSDA